MKQNQKKYIITTFSAILTSISLCTCNGTTLKFGHRGASFDAPENTLASIKHAFALGADGVEVDIQMTRDNKIILLHDDTLKRTATYTKKLQEKTGLTYAAFKTIINTPICQLTYDEIKDIDIGLWKGEKWAYEKIPTLESVLRFILSWQFAFQKTLSKKAKPQKTLSQKFKPKKIQIEIKGEDSLIIPELKKILSRYPKKIISKTVILIGFDLATMKLAKQEIPYCTVLLVTSFKKSTPPCNPLASINTIIQAGLDGIDFEANPTLITPEIAQEAHKHKKLIGTWVYPKQDTLENLRYFEKIGVDFHTTNLPPEIATAIQTPANS